MNDSTSLPSLTMQYAVVNDLRDCGFAWLDAATLMHLLGDEAGAHWKDFGALWDDLGQDLYEDAIADGAMRPSPTPVNA